MKKTESLFSSSKHDKEVKKKSLKKLIQKLKKYENKKREKLEEAKNDETRKSLEKKILVASAQRKKGQRLLEELEA